MTGEPAGKSDADLLGEALAGGKTAFTLFIRRHQETVYRFVRRYVGDSEEASDLVQETFVAAWEAIGRFDRTRPAGAWLRRIALNKCRDWSRRRAIRHFFYRARDIDALEVPAPASMQSEADTLAEHEGLLSRLDDAIAALPAALKEPLILTALEGLTHRQAAALLGITAKAVETRIHRARRILGRALDEQ